MKTLRFVLELSEEEVGASLKQLIDSSLLNDNGEYEEEKVRFSIYPLFQNYLQTKLDKQPSAVAEKLVKRHIQYFSFLAERREYEALNLDNMRFVLDWCVRYNPKKLIQLVYVLSYYFYNYGLWEERIERAHQALDASRTLADEKAEAWLLINELGYMSIQQGKYKPGGRNDRKITTMDIRINSPNLLAIMCKFPAPGNGKTRLAKSIGIIQAASVNRALLLDLIANHRGQSYCLIIIASLQDAPYRKGFQNLLPDIPIHIASGEDLRGSDSVMRETFNTYLNSFRKVIALYADTPLVTPSLINVAFEKLDSCDVIIGPDMGDGYYLVGMKEPYDLFTTLPPDRVPYRSKTIDLIRKLGLSYSMLDHHVDIDYVEDISMINWTDKDCKWSNTMEVLVRLNLLP